MAQVDRLRSLERGVLGSSSLCGGSFVAVFTFLVYSEIAEVNGVQIFEQMVVGSSALSSELFITIADLLG